jgi:hypothetical protein
MLLANVAVAEAIVGKYPTCRWGRAGVGRGGPGWAGVG